MIDRYAREEIKNIWDLNSKFNYYLKVELAVCEAYAKIGRIPKVTLEQIKQNAKFSVQRIDEIEKEVRHDVIAFLTNVNIPSVTSDIIILFALTLRAASTTLSANMLKVRIYLLSAASK